MPGHRVRAGCRAPGDGPLRRRRLILLLLSAAASCATSKAPEGGDRPLNTFYDREETEEIRRVQYRPFYWSYQDADAKRVDIVAPFYTYREDHKYKRWQLFPLLFYTARTAPEDEKSWFFIGFPFLWLGSDDFLIFPFGGMTRGVLAFHEFVMISPFYIRTKFKYPEPGNPGKEISFTSRYILWPFFGWGSDGQPGGRRKIRIAPFYGKTQDRGGKETGFVMWPFYTWNRNRLKNTDGYLIWPFYGRIEAPTRHETTVLWPFYNDKQDYMSGERDTTVFPFWRHVRGGDRREVRRLWPFSEYRRDGFNTTEWRLWPFWRETFNAEPYVYARYNWVIPFYKRVERYYRQTGVHAINTKVWPVGHWETHRDGGKEVAIPVYLPWRTARPEATEGWRPFVSLYHRYERPDGEINASAALGLYMYRRKEERKRVSLLFGLLGWDTAPDESFLRLFWGLRLRLSGGAKSATG